MFERFRKSRDDDTDAAAVATRDRELDEANSRVDRERFERTSPGERDRSVAAGEGDADLDANRSFEREDMARGDGTTALDREHARDDLARDDVGRGDATARDRDITDRDDMTGRGDAAARDDATARDLDAGHDGMSRDERDAREGSAADLSPGERDRGVSTGGAGAAAAAGGAAAMAHHERAERDDAVRDRDLDDDRATARDRDLADDRRFASDRDVDDDRTLARDRTLDRDLADDRMDGVHRHAPVMRPEALDTVRARQRDRFGGIQWGSDFFGWLCAIGLASILTAALVGAGVALGLSTSDAGNAQTAQQIGLGGGIALLVVLAIAWFCGGYVAGRMARFDGARQGIGVWLWTILAAIVVAALAAIGGSEYDIFQRLNLPRIAVGGDTLTAGGAIAGAAAIVVTLLFAVIGGKVGERYHRRVDRVATDEYVVED